MGQHEPKKLQSVKSIFVVIILDNLLSKTYLTSNNSLGCSSNTELNKRFYKPDFGYSFNLVIKADLIKSENTFELKSIYNLVNFTGRVLNWN